MERVHKKTCAVNECPKHDSDGRSQITHRSRRVSQPRSATMDEGTPQAPTAMKA